jgi:phosphate starvation-inducible PhoH-like protein
VRDVSFCHLNAHDVVRHSLVTDIVQAYGRYDESQQRTDRDRPARPSPRRR